MNKQQYFCLLLAILAPIFGYLNISAGNLKLKYAHNVKGVHILV